MKKTLFPFFGLIACALCLWGCGSDKQATSTLTKFEHVFQVCKDETMKQKLEPGKHPCAKVSSIALDKTLRDTGLGESKIKEMRDAWVEQKGFKDYYIPEDKR